MGVVAAPHHAHTKRNYLRAGIGSAAATYAILLANTAFRHEPWADEAHSWLLARDASLVELWTRLLHYEGTPGLWQTLLHILQRAGLPYSGLNAVSGLLGFAGAGMLAVRAPFPLAIRLALPFTYYLFYQYAVVARSYALLPVLLFACALVYRELPRRIWIFTALACLMAAVSIHGLALSAAVWLGAHISLLRQRRWQARLLAPAIVYTAALALVIACARPAPDVTFVRHLNTSVPHLLLSTQATFADAFTGEWISSAAAVALTLPFLWRNKALVVFLLAAGMLCVVNGLIYAQVWHRGILFLVWLFAMWVAADRAGKLSWPSAASFVAMIAIQCYWTAATASYDWRYPYSGAKAAAQFIREQHLDRSRIYAVGYACTAVQPYFPANIFANVHAGKGPTYWDWSARNHNVSDLDRLTVELPDYVLVGYTGVAEQLIWNSEVRRSGYRLVRHFDGNLFWHTAVLEPDAFELYRRP